MGAQGLVAAGFVFHALFQATDGLPPDFFEAPPAAPASPEEVALALGPGARADAIGTALRQSGLEISAENVLRALKAWHPTGFFGSTAGREARHRAILTGPWRCLEGSDGAAGAARLWRGTDLRRIAWCGAWGSAWGDCRSDADP